MKTILGIVTTLILSLQSSVEAQAIKPGDAPNYTYEEMIQINLKAKAERVSMAGRSQEDLVQEILKAKAANESMAGRNALRDREAFQVTTRAEYQLDEALKELKNVAEKTPLDEKTLSALFPFADKFNPYYQKRFVPMYLELDFSHPLRKKLVGELLKQAVENQDSWSWNYLDGFLVDSHDPDVLPYLLKRRGLESDDSTLNPSSYHIQDWVVLLRNGANHSNDPAIKKRASALLADLAKNPEAQKVLADKGALSEAELRKQITELNESISSMQERRTLLRNQLIEGAQAPASTNPASRPSSEEKTDDFLK